MKRKVIPFIGSMNEVAESSVLRDEVLNDIQNFEHKDTGKLTKRVDTVTYNAGLNAEIDSVFSGGKATYSPEEPFYPPRMPSGSYGDVLYPVFGETNDYMLVLFYRTDVDTWTYEDISISGIMYNGDSVLRISYSRDKMLIADGVNKSHFVTINQDNEFVYGVNELPRPTNKPEGIDTVDYDPSIFQENLESGSYINYCGVYRYWYTFVTEDGDESNPSPASDWIDMQFFKKDDDDLDERMVKSVTITNLEITSNAIKIIEQIKYFRIYREELQFTNGIETRIPLFIKEIEISDKDGDNQFTDTIAILSGDSTVDIDYENDASPIGNDICSVGGATVLGGFKKKQSFPFNFDHYREVTLTNPNARSYVDGVVRMDFDDMDNFGMLPTIPDWNFLTNNPDKVMFFDNDLTTPLATVYQVSEGFDFSNNTDRITNGGFDDDTDWTTGGDWEIKDGIADNLGDSDDNLTQTTPPLAVDTYYIAQMEFSLSGSDSYLTIKDYFLQGKDGTGNRRETWVLNSTTDTFTINKTAISRIKKVDNVKVYGTGESDGVTQCLTAPEITSDTGWTPEAGSSWVYDNGAYRNV